MNWEAIGAIGEIVGAVAVVATLAYLAVQLRHNTKNVQSSAYGMWANGVSDLISTATTDARLDQILREGWYGELSEDTWGQWYDQPSCMISLSSANSGGIAMIPGPT